MPRSRGLRGRRAFTLVDVLVTLGVVALLIGILLPGLSKVRESSRRVVCASNLRQIGLGLALYADNSKDQLPDSVFLDGDERQADNKIEDAPENMMTLRLPRVLGQRARKYWDGLGLLYSTEMLPESQIFYCPSHHGEFKFEPQADDWLHPRSERALIGNYHYRGEGPNHMRLLSFIEPSRSAIVADGLRTVEDYNHLLGLNVLRADLSLFWLADPAGRIPEFLEYTGQNSFEEFGKLWDQLDAPDESVLPGR